MKSIKNKLLIITSISINIILLIWLIVIFSYKHEDVNKDGEVNALDLLIVQKYILNSEE